MEAHELMTVDDLLAWTRDERVELIDGDIVQRPMSRFEHGQAQTALIGQSFPLVMRARPGGWWIVPEISVRYGEHHCPATTSRGGARSACLSGRPAS
jgi:Uma2 family endonuclease